MRPALMVIQAATLLAIPLAVDAQADLAALPGQRVRVRIETGPLHARTRIGTVASISDDSLFLRMGGRRLIAIEAGEISSLEVSQGQKSHTVAGMLLGAGAGLALGLATRPSPPRGKTNCTPRSGDMAPFDATLAIMCGIAGGLADHSVETARVALPVIGTLAGGLLGALLGSRVKSDEWAAAVPEVSAVQTGLGVRWTLPATR